MVNGKDMNLYESAIIGMGQGGAGQMTPFQLALIASAPGNLEGKLMKPKIEADLAPQVFSQVLSPAQAREVRDIMSTVTEEAGGTAKRALAKVMAAGIRTGGKTGTADKDVPVYNPDGTVKKVTKRRKNADGEWVEYQDTVTFQRWDALFLCLAPLDNPQLAIAVAVEDVGGGGFGGTVAAPIAADIIFEALRLGLLGERRQAPERRTR